jgi:hypothetical protein
VLTRRSAFWRSFVFAKKIISFIQLNQLFLLAIKSVYDQPLFPVFRNTLFFTPALRQKPAGSSE